MGFPFQQVLNSVLAPQLQVGGVMFEARLMSLTLHTASSMVDGILLKSGYVGALGSSE